MEDCKKLEDSGVHASHYYRGHLGLSLNPGLPGVALDRVYQVEVPVSNLLGKKNRDFTYL